jgi:hypothetical protein
MKDVEVVVATADLEEVRAVRAAFVSRSIQAASSQVSIKKIRKK